MGCCISIEKSIEVKWKDTVPFTLPLKNGYVIKVYDGDTITIANRLPLINDDTIYRFSVRLNGIDTPEIKGKTFKFNDKCYQYDLVPTTCKGIDNIISY